MVSVDKLTIRFGSVTLFSDISFVVNSRDRIALVGKNGAGKSTMLKVFAGIQPPTTGSVSIPKDITIGYLPQHMIHNDGVTVREEAEKAFSHIFELQNEIENLSAQLATREDYDSPEYARLIEQLTHANERLDMMGANDFQGREVKLRGGILLF